jgi:hypothetical protein
MVLLAQVKIRYWLASTAYDSIGELGRDLERRTGLSAHFAPPSRWGSWTEQVHLTGLLPDMREARIDFFMRPAGKTQIPCARLAVRADPALHVSVYRESLLTPLAKWLGFTHDVDSGDRRFDEQYVVSTDRDQSARRAYAHGFKEAVDAAFGSFHVDSFEIANGRLTVEFPTQRLEPGSYKILLEILATAVAAFDRVPIVVHVLGGERRALAGPGGRTRCAYCHGDVDGSEEDLVACDRCHTVLHSGCWEELGHCPLLGCSGHDPERARSQHRS